MQYKKEDIKQYLKLEDDEIIQVFLPNIEKNKIYVDYYSPEQSYSDYGHLEGIYTTSIDIVEFEIYLRYNKIIKIKERICLNQVTK